MICALHLTRAGKEGLLDGINIAFLHRLIDPARLLFEADGPEGVDNRENFVLVVVDRKLKPVHHDQREEVVHLYGVRNNLRELAQHTRLKPIRDRQISPVRLQRSLDSHIERGYLFLLIPSCIKKRKWWAVLDSNQ